MHLSTLAAAALPLLASLATTQSTVYLIRHGEKPSDGSNGLSAQGQERAQCLVNVFDSSSQYEIGYIMAETPQSDGSQQRPYDTVEPLAHGLGLTVDTSCERDDSDCVADAVASWNDSGNTGNVLICWEHGQLTDIAGALGGPYGSEDGNPPEYPDSNYNLIWTMPYSYSDVTSITSEDCPGLDD